MMGTSITNEQIVEAAKSRLHYQEDRHCSTCAFSSQKDVDWYECHINRTYPFTVLKTASCQFHERKKSEHA
jgi:disulfide oxidoreductase YuzD